MSETAPGRRIAFFGGSFDPPHLGHLAVARAALEGLGLDAVLFAPVGIQPLKHGGAAASFEDRAEMTRLAIAGEKRFALSLADVPALTGVPNYTLETLRALRRQMTPGDALYCLMGADAFATLKHWWQAAEIPFVAPLIVASRPGFRLEELDNTLPEGVTAVHDRDERRASAGVQVETSQLRNAAGRTAPIYLLPGLDVDISATAIRRRLQEALAGAAECGSIVPSAVAEYIRSHGLYL